MSKKNIITVSKKALQVFKNICKDNNSTHVLFNIESGGCNGFKYNLQPSSKINKLDEIVKIDDVNIQVCHLSIMHLLGTHVDWKKDFLGERFVFENPNSTAKCGCGSTFSL